MEAECFADIGYSDRIRIAVSAAKPDRAEAEARRFAQEGARGLISFGLCGGLDPNLKAGDLVAPNQIVCKQDMWGISPFLIGRSVVQAEFGLGSDTVVSHATYRFLCCAPCAIRRISPSQRPLPMRSTTMGKRDLWLSPPD